jgi:RNA polymerase sigma factor (sigma-70 family)
MQRKEFAKLVLEHQARLRMFIRMLGALPDSVDDLAQDAFVVAYERIDTLEDFDQAGPWLRSIARNLVRNELRKSSRQRRVVNASISEAMLAVSDEPVTAPWSEDWFAALRTCLERLPEPVDNSVALLNQVVNVVWSDGTKFSIGDSVSSHQTLHLESGLVQLQFFRGAVLTLAGPAKLEVRDQDHVMLHEGTVWEKVPVPARGFTVLTPETKIVDLGTEFGVSATPGQRTEVHVFEGLVELYDPSAPEDATSLHELVTGQSIRVDGDGNSVREAKRITAMPSESLLQQNQDKQLQQGFERWQKWSAEFRNDPRVLIYYDFAPPETSPATLQNLAAAREDSDGSIIGCAWTEGRWPQKSALDFKRPSDRVRFHLPGQYKSITLAAWVRVDGLDRLLSSLLLTDGWDAGEVHWQFDQQGQLGLSVGQASGVAWRYTSPLVDLTRLGQWIHVASVFDGSNKTVRHYFNGQRVPCEASLDYDGPIRIGDAELCNWGRPVDKTSHAIRNFNGRMDEFLMLDDALTEMEIMQIYEAGNRQL